MSGHSKWSTIKRKKGAKDQARGKLFSRLSKDIMVAVQQGGPDIDLNFSLRLAVDKAKQSNMPSDNIERAIKKASGELKGEEKMVSVTYEAYGPDGSMLIIDCNTDNSNRTVTDVKQAINTSGGKMASEGSIVWQFDTVGLVNLVAKKEKADVAFGKDVEYEDLDLDELQMEILNHEGIEDIEIDGNQLTVIVNKDKFNDVRDSLMSRKLKVEDANLVRMAQNEMELDEENLEKLNSMIEKIEDIDDVDQVWTNISNA